MYHSATLFWNCNFAELTIEFATKNQSGALLGDIVQINVAPTDTTPDHPGTAGVPSKALCQREHQDAPHCLHRQSFPCLRHGEMVSAAKDASYFALAIELANRSPSDSQTAFLPLTKKNPAGHLGTPIHLLQFSVAS